MENKIDKNAVSWLTHCPASDVNFKGTLRDTNIATIQEALKDKTIGKTATKALEIQLRRLQKNAAQSS